MKSIDGIKSGLDRKDSNKFIARKIYLSYPCEVFKNNEDKEFDIKNNISNQFEIPFSSIEIVGSSKTGLSFIKDKLFEPGISDLDIAIISLPLFNKFVETAHQLSKGYTDLTVFQIFGNYNTSKQFSSGLSRGFVNTFFMPKCDLKNKWLEFFNTLSNSYFELFKSINAGIYASEYFFECKQEECINHYTKNPQLYDEISSKI